MIHFGWFSNTVLGRMHLAPFGTMCTIDYWHGNFKHYRVYMAFLIINAFFTPFMVMSGIYFRGLQNLVKHESGRSPLSKFEHKHIVGMAKLCAIGFINVIFAWSPFFLLCLCKFFLNVVNDFFMIILLSRHYDCWCSGFERLCHSYTPYGSKGNYRVSQQLLDGKLLVWKSQILSK